MSVLQLIGIVAGSTLGVTGLVALIAKVFSNARQDEALNVERKNREALEAAVRRLEDDVDGLVKKYEREHEERIELGKEVEYWKGRYEEMEKYTARPALERLEHLFRDTFHALVDRDEEHVAVITQVTTQLANVAEQLERLKAAAVA